MHVAVQGNGGFLAGGNGVDRKLRPGGHIAANKDVRLCGLKCEAVADDGAHLQRLICAGADRGAAAGGIGFAELHDLQTDRGDLTVPAGDPCRCAQELELHALGERILDLLAVRLQLALAAAVDTADLFCAETQRRACDIDDIDGDVAAADDGNGFADIRLLAEIDAAQEIHAAEHACERLARTADRRALLRADGNIEAAVALLAQLGDGNVLADFHAALEFHAHLPENFDLGVHDLLFQTEARYAEHEHAAGNRIAVEHGHGVALFGQIIGTGHAGHTSAH